jgi:general secretion pathway protein J
MLEARGWRLEATRQSRQVYTAFNLKRGRMGRALLQPDSERALSELCLPAGFTLLEILIAIAILALVVTSLYGAYSGTIETTEKVERLRDIDQTARLVLMQMADDLKSLYYQKTESDVEESPFRFSGGMEAEGEEGTVVEFASTSHLGFDLNFPSLRINRVRYVLEKESDNERYHKLVRIETPFADLPGEREESSVELADSVESLTLNYLQADGQSFSQWDTRAKETEGLPPRLVNIRLQMAEDKSRIFTTSVALQVWEKEEEEGAKESKK